METINKKEYFLNPGELIISKEPVIIKTVLGSCVAVCIYCKKQKIGAICHYLLPVCPDIANPSTKYGDIAINLMIKKLKEEYHCEIIELKAYIIGGAFIVFDEKQVFFVGEQNVEIAKKVLDKHKIPIIYTDVLGERGKRVIFNTETGEIKVSIIEHINYDNLFNNV
ncbi:MAG: chemotaxis protein CheD [Exilispira sp.]